MMPKQSFASPDMDPQEPEMTRDEGLGAGVEHLAASSGVMDGCQKLATFPMTGAFWTRPPKRGQA